jgi:hypothetical protein
MHRALAPMRVDWRAGARSAGRAAISAWQRQRSAAAEQAAGFGVRRAALSWVVAEGRSGRQALSAQRGNGAKACRSAEQGWRRRRNRPPPACRVLP